MEIAEKVVDTTEQILAPLGLMQGPNAIPKRMVVGAILGGLVVATVKPRSMFDDQGNTRPWKLMYNTNMGKGGEPTNFPWFVGPVVGAFVLGVLI